MTTGSSYQQRPLLRMQEVVARCATVLFLVTLVGLPLFGERLLPGLSILGAGYRETMAVFRDPGTQWMVFVCVGIYFVTFIFLGKRREQNVAPIHRPAARKGQFFLSPDLWLSGLLLIAALAYLSDYDRASSSTQALMLLAGAAVGKGARLWAYWRKPENGNSPPFALDFHSLARCRIRLLLFILLALLAVAALWRTEGAMLFQYRGLNRWSGPWDNPNTFGLLMGTGLVIGAGLMVASFEFRVPGSAMWRRWVLLLFLLGCAGCCGIGLLKSYSRGAWLGAVVGIAVLCFRMVRFQVSSLAGKGLDSCHARISWLHRNSLPLFALIASILVAAFWQFRQTEWHPVRRAFSVGNRNDFSWRNRVVAWEGALAMMADRPIAGFGWNQPEKIYEKFYRPPKVVEGMAIQLNHFLVLGMSLGLPAVICFGMYLGLSLTQNLERGTWYRGASPSQTHSPPSSSADWPETICRAGVMVLLVGLWFDGGLFNLATAAPLWMLLELGRGSVAVEETAREISAAAPIDPPSPVRGYGGGWFVALIAVLLLTGLLWAKARDSLHREWLSLKTPDGRLLAVAVMPDRAGPYPAVVFAHGSGGSAESSGEVLQQFAALGFVAFGLEYDKTNQAVFEAQFAAILDHLAKQKWVQNNSVAWIGNSLGAQRQLSFLARHPERRPAALVRLNGGMVAELEAGESVRPGSDSMPGLKTSSLSRLPVWLAHGENDEIFPADEVRKVAEILRAAGASVQLDVFPGRGHGFSEDQPLLVRMAGEFCARELGAKTTVLGNAPPTLWYFWLPAGVFACALLVRCGRRRNLGRETARLNRCLCFFAFAAVIVAALISTAHFVLPFLRVAPATIKLARQWCVRPELHADYDWLVQQPDVKGRRIGDLLDQITLASLQRGQFAASVPEGEWREFVLSPMIDGAGEEISWRRELWEWVAPRVRRETDFEQGALVVLRFLRLRVALTDSASTNSSVAEAWRLGIVDKPGFERLMIAGMRAAGIPARKSVNGQCEILVNGHWKHPVIPLQPGPTPSK